MIIKDAFQNLNKEIALMKKLNHANVIKLHEVIDDPDEDKLFMSLIFRNSNFKFKIISLRLCFKRTSN